MVATEHARPAMDSPPAKRQAVVEQADAPVVPYRADPDTVLDSFARKLADRLFEHMRASDVHTGGRSEQKKVVDFFTPDELRKKLRLNIASNPASLDDLLQDCQDTIRYSVDTSHVHFFNQLFSQVDMIAVLGEWLTVTLNTSMYTYEVAPVFILMEEYLIKKIGGLLEFTNPDGIFAPGGSQSNLYSMLAARHRHFPHSKKEGWRTEDRPAVFMSSHAHYSTTKNAVIAGIGTDACVKVQCDELGRMLPSDLEAKIVASKAAGRTPFYVCATAGTTVLGAYDDLEAIAPICKKYGLWLHVDGAWGGSVILSRTHRQLVKGSQLVDSFTWNPHKMMGVPLQCSLIMINNKPGLLKETNSAGASYLFQPDKLYPIEYDTGDKSIQCGRKVDCFKLWLTWKARGDAGMEALVDRAIASSELLAEGVRSREGFELVAPPQCSNVCFRYTPTAIRGSDWDGNDSNGPRRERVLDRLAPMVKQEMQTEGSTLVGHQRIDGKVNFWRMICINPNLCKKDIDFLLDTIQKYSERCVTKCMTDKKAPRTA